MSYSNATSRFGSSEIQVCQAWESAAACRSCGTRLRSISQALNASLTLTAWPGLEMTTILSPAPMVPCHGMRRYAPGRCASTNTRGSVGLPWRRP